MLVQAKSDIGKVRETNEDSFICKPPLFVVADGMGGHVAGEVASKTAVDTMVKLINARAGSQDAEFLLEQAINEANGVVFHLAQQNEEYAGMGTTVTAVYIDGAKVYWGHVGDSRLYLFRDDHAFQITQDHSLVGELLRSGGISEAEALTHPKRNILTRAVGTDEYLSIDTGSFDWLKGDRLLLCTDGLTNMVPDAEIFKLIIEGGDDRVKVVDCLIDKANDAGGYDNISVILVANGDC